MTQNADHGSDVAAGSYDRRATEPGPTHQIGRQAGFIGAAVTNTYDNAEMPL